MILSANESFSIAKGIREKNRLNRKIIESAKSSAIEKCGKSKINAENIALLNLTLLWQCLFF